MNDFNLLAHVSMNKSELKVASKSSHKLQEDKASLQVQQQKSGLMKDYPKKPTTSNIVSFQLLRSLIIIFHLRKPYMI